VWKELGEGEGCEELQVGRSLTGMFELLMVILLEKFSNIDFCSGLCAGLCFCFVS
jgi:hypothetical protein